MDGLFTRSFLPTWFALAGILAVQMAVAALGPDPVPTRPPMWTWSATLAATATVVAITGAWAFPRVRATTWLIGAMAVEVITLRHQDVAPGAIAPPAEEVFAFTTLAAVLLAIGAWHRARLDD